MLLSSSAVRLMVETGSRQQRLGQFLQDRFFSFASGRD
jgi:hypothetical protein